MGQDDYFWMLGEASDGMSLSPADGDKEQWLRATNGMGRVGLVIPESERFNAVLDALRKDDALQQYYISKTVSKLLPVHTFMNYKLSSNVSSDL